MVRHQPNLGTGKIQSTHMLKDSIPPSFSPSVTSLSLLESAAASVLLTPESTFLAWPWLMRNKPKTQLYGGHCHVASSLMPQLNLSELTSLLYCATHLKELTVTSGHLD